MDSIGFYGNFQLEGIGLLWECSVDQQTWNFWGDFGESVFLKWISSGFLEDLDDHIQEYLSVIGLCNNIN